MTEPHSLVLTGEIDVARQRDLDSAIKQYRNSSQPDVVLDLTDVTFFSSEGIALIARLHKIAQSRGGAVTLLNPSDQVVRIVEVCGMNGFVLVENRPILEAPLISPSSDPPKAEAS